MTPEEHLTALQALCTKLEPELDEMVNSDPNYRDRYHANDAITLACKLFDAIMDPDEATP